MPYKDKDKQREYQRQWVRANRKEFFDGKVCERCGSKENLHLHHKDPRFKLSHAIWSWSVERRNAEIAKCEVLCSGCHYKHHALLRKIVDFHGTITGYKNYNCRCPDCKRANAMKEAERRERIRREVNLYNRA